MKAGRQAEYSQLLLFCCDYVIGCEMAKVAKLGDCIRVSLPTVCGVSCAVDATVGVIDGQESIVGVCKDKDSKENTKTARVRPPKIKLPPR